MSQPTNLPAPILILIRGLPGSGKSYLAAELQKQFDPDAVVLLDPDATDYTSQAYADHVQALTADGVDPKLHAYRFLRSQAYAGIEAGKVIIWNQPFTNLEIFEKMTTGLTNYASEHGTSLSILVVEVEIEPSVAKQRVEARKQAGGHGPSENTFARFAREYTTAAADGYTLVTVHGDTDVAISVATVVDAVSALRHT